LIDPEKALDALKDAAAVIPKVYEDAAQPAARELGETLAGAVRVALSPVTFVVWSYDQVLEFVQPRVEERLARLKAGPQDIRQPAPEVAGPILSALRFPDQDPSLRELYLNLLARAMDGRIPGPHPAFVEVLRQLSPAEARLVPVLATPRPDPPPSFPAIAVNVFLADGSGFITPLPNVCALGRDLGVNDPTPQQWIDNLARLGLIEVDRTVTINTQALYEELQRHPLVESVRLQTQPQGLRFSLARHTIRGTEFGLAFARACTIEERTGVDAGQSPSS
jgi:hypothetical protein